MGVIIKKLLFLAYIVFVGYISIIFLVFMGLVVFYLPIVIFCFFKNLIRRIKGKEKIPIDEC